MIKKFYETKLYPKLMELGLKDEEIDKLRADLLRKASGNILEIGFGTGKNAEFYPTEIKQITAIDSNEAMEKHLRKRIGNRGLEANILTMSAEELGFEDNSFDCIVSTFTLCSIGDAGRALSEFNRVLKTGGRFLFLEHGKSPDKIIKYAQNIANPLFNVFGCGCNLNRDIKSIIEKSPMKIEKIESFYLGSKLYGYLYKGSAVKGDASQIYDIF